MEALLITKSSKGKELRKARKCSDNWPGSTMMLGKTGYWAGDRQSITYLGRLTAPAAICIFEETYGNGKELKIQHVQNPKAIKLADQILSQIEKDSEIDCGSATSFAFNKASIVTLIEQAL